jgi:phage terminase large subunit-like protein
MTDILEPNTLQRWQQQPKSFIREALRNPRTGKPFELFPAQEQWFDHCWQHRDDGRLRYSEQCFGAVKKSGKTTTAAIEVLTTVLVYGGRYAEAYCCAADLQQAQERVFAEIRRIVESSPLLKREAEIYASRIVFPQTSACIQAISADASGAAGAHPCIVSVDEAFTITNEKARRLYDELVPVTTVPVSIRLTTSTAGYSGESTLLEELYHRGMSLDEIAPNLRGGNGMLFCWYTEPVAPWQKVGGSHEVWLNEQRALVRPLQYARQFENKFVISDAQFIEGALWDACVKLDKPPAGNPMMPVFIGIDASTKRDSTAVLVVAGDKDNIILRDHKIFTPSPGNPIDFAEVENYLLALKKKYPLCTLVYDEYQLVSIMQRLAKWGWKVEEFVQSPQNLSAATQCLFDLIRYQRLHVYPDSKMRDAIMRTVVEEKTTGIRIVKNASEKNDIVLALAMAAYRCTQRHTTHVDLAWKYRAFDPNYVDPDAPQPPAIPESELTDAPRYNGDWWRWKKIPRSNQKIPGVDSSLVDYLKMLDTLARGGFLK